MLLIFSFDVSAQETSMNDKQKLIEVANNPMANAYKLFFQDVLVFDNPNNSNTLYTNVLVPSSLGENLQLNSRLVIPFGNRQFPDGTTERGFGNIQYQMTFSRKDPYKIGDSDLSIGVGPSFTFGTSSYDVVVPGDDNWGIGAALFTVYKSKSFLALAALAPSWGVGEDKSDSAMINVLLSYGFPSGFSVLSSPVIIYNESFPGEDKWIVPVGMGVGQLFKVGGKLPVNLSVTGNYNVVRPDFMEDARWQLGINLMVILPSPKLMKAMKLKQEGEL